MTEPNASGQTTADTSETKDDEPKPVRSRGLLFPNDLSVLTFRMRRSLRSDGYEGKEATAAVKLIRPGDVVMELGGGIGFMSTLISKKTPAKEIHTFEANPDLIPYIERVHKLNNVENVTIHHALLGEGSGETNFYVRENILASSLDPDDARDGAGTPVSVKMVDANETLQQIKPSVLVCDIEGAEENLLPMMDLSGLRAVLIELHPQWIRSTGIRKVFTALDRAGLVFFPRWSHGKVAVFRSDW